MTDNPVLNIADAKVFPAGPEGGSDRMGAMVSVLGGAVGLGGLGCMLTVVEPGKRAFSYHNHLANDEMFVILEGTGTYRFGGQEYPVKAGDICGAPRGGPETAHQLINTGTGVLKYLGISTKIDPEVVEYPDSGKYAALAMWPGEDFRSAHLRAIHRADSQLDYFDGEEI